RAWRPGRIPLPSLRGPASVRAPFPRERTRRERTMAANNGQQGMAGLQIQGGAAIVAPVSAFPNGVPGNAMIVIPVNKPTDELTTLLKKGPTAMTVEQMWKLLGFNGPAVHVQDDQG